VQIRNHIFWRNYNQRRSNLRNGTSFPQGFSVNDMVLGTGYTWEEMIVQGSAVGVVIRWTCDYDKATTDSDEENCSPTFTFLRLDDPNSALSVGYNFRYTHVFRTDENPEQQRDLFKVYGIRFVFLTSGIGRKFDFVTLFQSIGSGIGVFFISGYISDLLCVWVLPSAPYYRNKKYMNVDEQQEENERQQWNALLTREQLNKAYF